MAIKHSLLTFVLLGGCAAVAPVTEIIDSPRAASSTDKAENDTRRLITGVYSSPAWVNDRFTGTHVRELTDNRLKFQIEQTVEGGGWDTGVGLAQEPAIPLGTVAKDETICFAYDLDLDALDGGKWWAGPKISVNWAAMTDTPSTGDWYENYVVEVANKTPAELEADLFDYFDAESLGESVIAGATYRHIRLRYQEWWQYWSIRQDYRAEGQLPLGPIFDAWSAIPRDLTYDGVKANLETHGPVLGKGQIIAVIPGTDVDVMRLSNCK